MVVKTEEKPEEKPTKPGEETPPVTTETPPFMEGIIDKTPEQIEAREVLGDLKPGEEKPGEEKPGEEKPGEEKPPEGELKPGEEKPGEEKPGEEKPGEEKPGEEKPGEEKPPETTPLKEEEQKRETLTKALDKGINNREINEQILKLVSKPLIKVDAPNPETYKDKEGAFDIQSYLQDYMTAVVIQLQKSIAGGHLGAIQFGVLKRAIQEESEERVTAIKTDEAAKITWDKLTKKFPILKTDETVADKFERVVYGEKYRRAEKAKAEKKEYVDLAYEDYEKLAGEVVGGQPSPAPAGKTPTEALPGSPQLGGGGVRGKDPVGDDIDDMIGLKNKKGVLF